MHAPRELGRHFAAGQPREMNRPELVGHVRLAVFVSSMHTGRMKTRLGDVGRVDRVTLLAAEVAFEPALRRGRNDQDEERTAGDIALDLRS